MGVELANGALLKLTKVSKHFGGLAAVQDLDLEVKPTGDYKRYRTKWRWQDNCI